MNSKGQGALEYLLLIGGAVLVAVVVIVLLLGLGKSTGGEVNEIVQTGITNMQDAAGTGGTASDDSVSKTYDITGTETKACDEIVDSAGNALSDCYPAEADCTLSTSGTGTCKYYETGCKCEAPLTVTDTSDPFDSLDNGSGD